MATAQGEVPCGKLLPQDITSRLGLAWKKHARAPPKCTCTSSILLYLFIYFCIYFTFIFMYLFLYRKVHAHIHTSRHPESLLTSS